MCVNKGLIYHKEYLSEVNKKFSTRGLFLVIYRCWIRNHTIRAI